MSFDRAMRNSERDFTARLLWWPAAAIVAVLIIAAVLISVVAIFEQTRFSKANAQLARLIGDLHAPRMMTDIATMPSLQTLDVMNVLHRRGIVQSKKIGESMALENPWQLPIIAYRPRTQPVVVIQTEVPYAACVSTVDFFLNQTDLGFTEIHLTHPDNQHLQTKIDKVIDARAARPTLTVIYDMCSFARQVKVALVFPLTPVLNSQ